MVTYCVGSARQKRAYFLRQPQTLMLDNIEVVFCASENGRNYFAYGDIPFSEFTVDEYLKYKTALCGGNADLCLLENIGIKTSARVGGLCAAQMRCVQLAEKSAALRHFDSVVINLDGTRYTRKNMRYLTALLGLCENAFVCVTDNRFVKHAKRIDKIMRFGNGSKSVRRVLYKLRKVNMFTGLCERRYGVVVTKVSVM